MIRLQPDRAQRPNPRAEVTVGMAGCARQTAREHRALGQPGNVLEVAGTFEEGRCRRRRAHSVLQRHDMHAQSLVAPHRRPWTAWLNGFVAVAFSTGASAQEQMQPPPTASQPAQAAASTPAAPESAPPAEQRVYSYPAGCDVPDADGVVVPCSGQWVYTDAYGWIWVPGGSLPVIVDGVPYTYLYTAAYGWTWYVSPWGWGPYVYGAWVVHPWLPVGWRGAWVAGPGISVRLGGRPGYRGGAAIHGPGAWHGAVHAGAPGGRAGGPAGHAGGHGGGHR